MPGSAMSGPPGAVSRTSWIGLLLLGAWFGFLAFGGLSHEESLRLGADLRAGRVRMPAELPRVLGGYPADDGDVRRAWSYARAVLGRSYLGGYVRDRGSWDRPFVDGPEVSPGRPLRPWRDFLVEYPPGYFLAALPPALLARTPETYRSLFALEMAGCAVLGLWIAERLRRQANPGAPSVLGWGALCTVLVGLVVTHRTDGLVLLELTILLWAAVQGRPTVAGLATALLFWTKGVPAIAGPFLALPWARERRWSELRLWAVVAMVVTVLLWAPAIVVGGPGLLDIVRYQAGRPVQAESTAAALAGLLRIASPGLAWPVESHASTGVGGRTVGGLAFVLQLALCAAWAWAAWRARSRATGAQAARLTLVLVLWMVLGPVFSPQFLVWVLPAAVLAGALVGRPALAWLAGLCALHQVVYPGAYDALRGLEPWACTLVLVRNVALGCWAALVWRASGDASAEEPASARAVLPGPPPVRPSPGSAR